MLLNPLPLTPSGRPKLLEGELERAFLHKADLQFETEGGIPGIIAKRHEDGYAVLTTMRLMWVHSSKAPEAGASCFVPLSCIECAELRATKVWTQTKLRLRIHLDGQKRPVSGSRASSISELRLVSSSYANFAELLCGALYSSREEGNSQRRLGSTSGGNLQNNPAAPPAVQQMPQGPDQALVQQLISMGFHQQQVLAAHKATAGQGLEAALQWLFDHEKASEGSRQQPAQGPQGASPQQLQSLSLGPPPTGLAGIAGILRREQEIAARNDRTMDEAFQDLRGLMTKAQEMVQLAEKFRGTLTSKGGGEGSPGGEEGLDPEMQQQLIDMGIASPVTREIAGALYHQELSRQLGDFLEPRLQRAGGMLTLADVYCLFNRARGTELLSPDDLLQAVHLFPAIRARMHLRTFPSGFLVVQASSHSDDQVCAKIGELTAGEGLGPPISAADVAAALAVPVTIAAQHLATAEGRQVLCRDDGPEGLRYFRNFFKDQLLA